MPAHPVPHEQAAHVFSFLAEFGKRYPSLCEGDRTLYRDLCRAALLAIREGEWCEEAAVGPSVERVMDQCCRSGAQVDVGFGVLDRLHRAGVYVRWDGGARFVAGPRGRVTAELAGVIRRYAGEIKAALAADCLSA